MQTDYFTCLGFLQISITTAALEDGQRTRTIAEIEIKEIYRGPPTGLPTPKPPEYGPTQVGADDPAAINTEHFMISCSTNSCATELS